MSKPINGADTAFVILRAKGAVLLLTCMALVTAIIALLNIPAIRDRLHARQALILPTSSQAALERNMQGLRDGLLGYLAVQGYNVNSYYAELPCPDKDGDGTADTPCDTFTSNSGLIPVRSLVAGGRFVQAVPLPISVQANLTDNARLHYAVAPGVFQADAVGQGTTLPSGKLLRIVDGRGRVVSDQTVAIIGASLTKTSVARQWMAGEPYRLIEQPVWLDVLYLKNRVGLAQNLRLWLNNQPSGMANPAITPQLQADGTVFQAQEPACQCSCTQLRCSCQCNANATWQSAAPCDATSAAGICHAVDGLSECNAAAGEICAFKGPAWLKTHWPIGLFSPQPLAGQSCQVSRNDTCPLSTKSSPCTCRFGWPTYLPETQRSMLRLAWQPTRFAAGSNAQSSLLTGDVDTAPSLLRPLPRRFAGPPLHDVTAVRSLGTRQ
ncbi:MAG: hypothetical protein ACK5NY_03865 [Burkholderiaceae bacterium]